MVFKGLGGVGHHDAEGLFGGIESAISIGHGALTASLAAAVTGKQRFADGYIDPVDGGCLWLRLQQRPRRCGCRWRQRRYRSLTWTEPSGATLTIMVRPGEEAPFSVQA